MSNKTRCKFEGIQYDKRNKRMKKFWKTYFT